MAPPTENFLRTFGDWYLTGRNSDLTLVTADGGEFHVHDMVISVRCPQVKELATDIGEGRLEVAERREVLQRVLCWAYDVEWPDVAGMGVGDALGLLAQVGRASDTYDLDNLSEAALDRMVELVKSKLTTMEETLNFLLSCTNTEWDGLGLRMAVTHAQTLARQSSQQEPAAGSNHDVNIQAPLVREQDGEQDPAAEDQAAPSHNSKALSDARRRDMQIMLGSDTSESVDAAAEDEGHGAANAVDAIRETVQLKQEEDHLVDRYGRTVDGQPDYPEIIRVPAAPSPSPSPAPGAGRPKRKAVPSTKAKEAAGTRKKAAPPTKKRKTAPTASKSSANSRKKPAAAGARKKTHCICKAEAEDGNLVQCEDCENWFNPLCIGKSRYSGKTVKSKRKWVMGQDEKRYRTEPFTCVKCDGKTA